MYIYIYIYIHGSGVGGGGGERRSDLFIRSQIINETFSRANAIAMHMCVRVCVCVCVWISSGTGLVICIDFCKEIFCLFAWTWCRPTCICLHKCVYTYTYTYTKYLYDHIYTCAFVCMLPCSRSRMNMHIVSRGSKDEMVYVQLHLRTYMRKSNWGMYLYVYGSRTHCTQIYAAYFTL